MTKTTLAYPDDDAMDALKAIAESVPLAEGSDDAAGQIALSILSKTETDDILTPAAAPGLGDVEGLVFTIHGIRRVDGGQNAELGFYLLVDATEKSSGVRGAYSTGATNPTAQLLALFRGNEFPCDVRVIHVQSKRNPDRVIQWLGKVDHF